MGVRVVTEELLREWSLDNNLAHLRALLDRLPEDMLELYPRILDNMEPCQRDIANRIASLVVHAVVL